MKLSLLPYIIYALFGCTYETAYVTAEDTMGKQIEYGWSQSGKLTPGRTGQAVNMQVQFQEIGNYTIQLGIDDTYTHGALEFTRARAEIIWNVKGNSSRRLIDCVDGASITGSAEAVSIKVTDDSSFLNALAEYVVSISIAKGVRASLERPYLTSADFSGLLVMVAGAGQTDIPIPADAGVKSVFVTISPDTIGTAIGAYDVLVHQSNGAGNTLRQYDPRQTDWVPIAPGATEINLVQSAAAPATVWTVTFGIDG